MLAYRHLFHAGNFADVFKHALLTQLLLGLTRKGKPFFYLDTHAGIGRYDLTQEWARKNAEHKDGIARVWVRKDVPPALLPYVEAVRADNADGKLQHYPGSPRIARSLMRSNDRAVLTELNKKDFAALEALFAQDRHVQVRLLDGYQALKAFLPPPERRGLIFIDSSFDRAQEFERLSRGLVAGYAKFATGVYALWYPLMEPTAMRAFERRLVATGIHKILQLELAVHGADWVGNMRGCGMLVVNPPFGFETAAREIVGWLWPVLSCDGEGAPSIRWLVPE